MERYGDSPIEVLESRKDKIVLEELIFWGGSIFPSDNIDSIESSKTDSLSVNLNLGSEDPLKMELNYEKLKQYGQAMMPLKEKFWSEKFWNINL